MVRWFMVMNFIKKVKFYFFLFIVLLVVFKWEEIGIVFVNKEVLVLIYGCFS